MSCNVGATEREIDTLSKTLVDLKSKFPEAAQLNDRINDIKGSLDGISKERDSMAKDIQP